MATQQFNSLAELQAFLQANPQFKGKITSGGQTTQIAPKERERNLLENIVGSFVDPFVGLGKKGLEFTNAAVTNNVGGFLKQDGTYKNQFFDEKDAKNFKANPFLDTVRDVAGVGSVFIPGGAFGKGLAGMVKAGAAGGALSSFAGQEGSNIDLGNIATGALSGGAFGGGVGLAGKGLQSLSKTKPGQGLNNVSNALNQFAEGRDLNAFRRRVGANAPLKFGGANLEKDTLNLAKAFGRQINSADDLTRFSDDLFNQFGNQIKGAAAEATQQGKLIDVNDIVQELEDQIQKPGMLPEIKAPIQKTIESIREAAPTGVVDPNVAYELRQTIGGLGKFSPLADVSEKSQAKVWNDVYGKLSDKLRDTLKETGFNNYDDVNRILETAIKQNKWAELAGAKARPTATVNDMAQDVGVFAGLGTGNPLMAIPGFAAGKALQSPAAETLLGKAARGVAGAIDSVNPVAGGIDEALQRAQTAAADRVADMTPQDIKKALSQIPDADARDALGMIDSLEEQVKELNAQRLGRQLGQYQSLVSRTGSGDNLKYTDDLLTEMFDKFPGVIPEEYRYQDPSFGIEHFINTRNKYREFLDNAYKEAGEYLANRSSQPTRSVPAAAAASQAQIKPQPQMLNPLQQLISNASQTPNQVKQFLDNTGLSRVRIAPNDAARAAGIAAGGNNRMPETADPNVVDAQTLASLLTSNQGQMPANQDVQTGMDEEAVALYQQLVTPTRSGGMGFTPTEAEKYMATVYGIDAGGGDKKGAQPKIRESERKYLQAAAAAERALGLLDSGKAGTGKINAAKNAVGGFLGVRDENDTEYLTRLSAARGAAINALAGASVPEAEFKRIAALIPSEFDEPKIARTKLRTFIEEMRSAATVTI